VGFFTTFPTERTTDAFANHVVSFMGRRHDYFTTIGSWAPSNIFTAVHHGLGKKCGVLCSVFGPNEFSDDRVGNQFVAALVHAFNIQRVTLLDLEANCQPAKKKTNSAAVLIAATVPELLN
jgi:hypothetical protein